MRERRREKSRRERGVRGSREQGSGNKGSSQERQEENRSGGRGRIRDLSESIHQYSHKIKTPKASCFFS